MLGGIVSVPPYGGPAIPRCWRGTARLACFYEISCVHSNGGPAIRGARPSEQCSLSRTLSVRPHVAHRQKKRPAPGAFYLAVGAVYSEPCSVGNSLLTAKTTGNFAVFDAQKCAESLQNPHPKPLFTRYRIMRFRNGTGNLSAPIRELLGNLHGSLSSHPRLLSNVRH